MAVTKTHAELVIEREEMQHCIEVLEKHRNQLSKTVKALEDIDVQRVKRIDDLENNYGNLYNEYYRVFLDLYTPALEACRAILKRRDQSLAYIDDEEMELAIDTCRAVVEKEDDGKD